MILMLPLIDYVKVGHFIVDPCIVDFDVCIIILMKWFWIRSIGTKTRSIVLK